MALCSCSLVRRIQLPVLFLFTGHCARSSFFEGRLLVIALLRFISWAITLRSYCCIDLYLILAACQVISRFKSILLLLIF
jgi:hypothetical protein